MFHLTAWDSSYWLWAVLHLSDLWLLMGNSGKAWTRYEHISFMDNPQNTLKKLWRLKALQKQCTVESLNRFLALASLHIFLYHSIKPGVCLSTERTEALRNSTGWVVDLLLLAIPSFENTPSSGKLFIKTFTHGHEREHILQRQFQLVLKSVFLSWRPQTDCFQRRLCQIMVKRKNLKCWSYPP